LSKKAVDRVSFLEKTYNVKAKAYQCQITDKDAVRKTIEIVIKEFGQIDSMIVNHGVSSTSSILDGSHDDWKRIIDIDLNGAFYVTKVTILDKFCCLIPGCWRTFPISEERKFDLHGITVGTYRQLPSIASVL
jgi:NADP-dependent 3-hydroxy acid dehydrogenase YdfG